MTPPAVAAATGAPAWLAADVGWHLRQTPRQLPSRALYDALGSALFDAICWLPWYPVTRAECRLLDAHGAEILDAACAPTRLVELGCGNGDKLHRLLRSARSGCAGHVDRLTRIDLVDVSTAALRAAAATLASAGGNALEVALHASPYEQGLRAVASTRRVDERLCVMFLGSNIGNFDPPGVRALLGAIRSATCPLDALVIGVDLVKPRGELLAAYDDPLGVTAAFNKNLLVRLNRELGATFDVSAFDHRAVWNEAESRVEMHLVSRERQHVDVPDADVSLDLRAGESIWTESSYKFTVAGFERQLREAAFEPVRHWVDNQGQFLLVLAVAS